MVPGSRVYLLIDANVLIDYQSTDLSILALASRHIGQIRIPSTILEEVDGLDIAECERLGLDVVEPELSQLIAAAEKHGALSHQDHLFLIIARENGWVCVTNDGALRRTCEKSHVPVRWGLELMIDLVALGQLEAEEALRAAEAIHLNNPLHISKAILDRFAGKLRKIVG